MTSPLAIGIAMGLEDDRLLYHLDMLMRMDDQGSGLNTNEVMLLNLVWDRLDVITKPRKEAGHD